jgi:hypothetical protein
MNKSAKLVLLLAIIFRWGMIPTLDEFKDAAHNDLC